MQSVCRDGATALRWIHAAYRTRSASQLMDQAAPSSTLLPLVEKKTPLDFTHFMGCATLERKEQQKFCFFPSTAGEEKCTEGKETFLPLFTQMNKMTAWVEVTGICWESVNLNSDQHQSWHQLWASFMKRGFYLMEKKIKTNQQTIHPTNKPTNLGSFWLTFWCLFSK